jgi:hypothetical protein
MISSSSAVPLRPFAEIMTASFADKPEAAGSDATSSRTAALRTWSPRTASTAAYRLADCASVVGVVFAALQIGFYIARRQQLTV